MGRPIGSKNKYSLRETFPVIAATNNKSKFWVMVTDFITYSLSHPGQKQIYFNKNYTMTHTGQKVGIVKVSEDIFTEIQKEKQEGHKEAIEYAQRVSKGIL